ncbi:extensin-like protein [Rhodovulum iodosum]|nr:extensin family protein [Rhodovulum robiginosum]RSK30729.1 extensin-like protein [Rhodovulum robiginosum]
MRLAAALLSLLLTATAAAALPESSPRPAPRPALGAEAGALPRVPLVPVHIGAKLRPQARPAEAAPTAAPPPRPAVPVFYNARTRPEPRPARTAPVVKVRQISSGTALTRSARPENRPRTPGQKAVLAAAGVRSQPSTVTRGRRGAICGDRDIRGKELAPIPGRIRGCGVEAPVQVTAIDGVALTAPATMDCNTARALKTWVRQGVKPTVGRLGGGVDSLRVVAHYACRTRNNKPGAKISEHGRGRAVDIAAINLKNGVSMTVLKGWRDPVQGKLLRAMHRSACGPFGTVLGPGSDGYHKDHFHLDTARYRSGTYCR